MSERLHLLIAHLSTDATVEHLAVDEGASPYPYGPREIATKCGKTGHWSRTAPRKGVCKACTKAVV